MLCSTTNVARDLPPPLLILPRSLAAEGLACFRSDRFVVGHELEMSAPGTGVVEFDAASIDGAPHHFVQDLAEHVRHCGGGELAVAVRGTGVVLEVDVAFVALDEVAEVTVGAVLDESAKDHAQAVIVSQFVAPKAQWAKPHSGSGRCSRWCLTLDRSERRGVVVVNA